MTYQQFDEKLQRINEITPAREQKIRARWLLLSRRGPIFFILTRGSIIFLWMVACFVFFAWRFHTLSVITSRLVLMTEVPVMVFMSLLMPAAAFIGIRRAVASLDKRANKAGQSPRFITSL